MNTVYSSYREGLKNAICFAFYKNIYAILQAEASEQILFDNTYNLNFVQFCFILDGKLLKK